MIRWNPNGIFPPLDDAGNLLVSSQTGLSASSVATGAATTVVSAVSGRLRRVIVTTAGTGSGSVLIYDNATTNSGLVVCAFPATVAVGQIYPVECPVVHGITAVNVLNGPVFTAVYD